MRFFARTLAAVDRLDQTDLEDFASFMEPDQAEAFLSEVNTIRNSK
ncbi:hypothetical protein OIE67_29895 [Nonomuraea fuscirosea]|nr:hypothetical protein [Nonomuraea fuscirosea]WSA48294.1 hypothetical protein OIE67_29895 [Nonomuraea fuscirosea]